MQEEVVVEKMMMKMKERSQEKMENETRFVSRINAEEATAGKRLTNLSDKLMLSSAKCFLSKMMCLLLNIPIYCQKYQVLNSNTNTYR